MSVAHKWMLDFLTSILADTVKENTSYNELRNTKEAPKKKDTNTLFSAIFKEYHKWLHLFRKEKVTLSQHQSWDHEIKLEPGKQLTFGPLY